MNYDVDYNYDIVHAILVLQSEGNSDPSCIEIVSKVLGRDLFVKPIIEDIRRRLSKVQKIIRKEYEFHTCLVSEGFYTARPKRGGSFREIAPITLAEAGLCIPLGQGIRPYGIRIVKDRNDLIYQLSVNHHLKSSSASLGTAYGKLNSGAKDGSIAIKTAANLIKRSHRDIITDEIRLLEQQADETND